VISALVIAIFAAILDLYLLSEKIAAIAFHHQRSKCSVLNPKKSVIIQDLLLAANSEY